MDDVDAILRTHTFFLAFDGGKRPPLDNEENESVLSNPVG